MSVRATPWLAWSLCVLCVALAAASLILALLNGRTLAEIFIADIPATIVTLAALTVSFSVVGGLIASHRPENPIGWIFLAAALFQGLTSPERSTRSMRSSEIPALFPWEQRRPG